MVYGMKKRILEVMVWLTIMPGVMAQTSYGPGIGGDSLNNNQISSIDVDNRFRATTSSTLLSLIWYDIYTSADSGYSAGTGGTIEICIETDDGTANHLPSGTKLACVTDVAPKTIHFPV